MQLSAKQSKTHAAPGCGASAIGFISIQIGFILVLLSQSFHALPQSALIWGGVLALICGLALFLGGLLRRHDYTDVDDGE